MTLNLFRRRYGTEKIIVMGADPSGYELKNAVKSHLQAKNYTIKDITESGAYWLCDVGDKVGAIISRTS